MCARLQCITHQQTASPDTFLSFAACQKILFKMYKRKCLWECVERLGSTFFYDRTIMHRNRFLVNKTKRCTEFQFYWYYYCTCFGQPFCPSSGVLSRTSALVHFVQLWWRFASRSRMARECHPTPASKRSSQLHKMYQSGCTAKKSWWWAERLPETCRVVVPTKL